MELRLVQQQLGRPVNQPGVRNPAPARRDNRSSWRNPDSPVALFSPAEMRHSFAIWPEQEAVTSKRRLRRYYCLRCKWTFSVDDSTGSVAPLDQQGQPIHGPEASARLATFGYGPCPVFDGLYPHQRVTQKVGSIESYRGRLASLIASWRLGWSVYIRNCVRSLSFDGNLHSRSAPK